jgi:hypothetical protein
VVLDSQAVDYSEMLVRAVERENEVIRMEGLKAKTLFVPKSSSLSTLN